MMSKVWIVSERFDGWIAIEHTMSSYNGRINLMGETGNLLGFLTLAEVETELRSRSCIPDHAARDRLQAINDPCILGVWFKS